MMRQDQMWDAKWREVMEFMKTNQRRPSKYHETECRLRNWWKHQQKLLNAGLLKDDRIERFKQLVEQGAKYRRVNQWG